MKGSARPRVFADRRLFALMLAMVSLLGCQSLSFDPKGYTVPESCWIALPPDGNSSGEWTNDDIILRYSFLRSQSQLRVSGSIRFTDRITKIYLLIQYFHLDLIPLDARGNVLDMIGLTTATGVNTVFDNSVEFKTVLTLPSNTEAFAFSYRGRTYGTKDGGFMDFWEYPLTARPRPAPTKQEVPPASP
jgi:hypothetical protein